jgi:hypothetical protein
VNAFPEFNEQGDLPINVYKANLSEVLEHFGKQTLQRRIVAKRLLRIYDLAVSTNHLVRFIIYGSFVTAKTDPDDIDIFLLMDERFLPEKVLGDAAIIFNHMLVHEREGASIFWSKRGSILGEEQTLIEDWQIKRGSKTRRGIVEVISRD